MSSGKLGFLFPGIPALLCLWAGCGGSSSHNSSQGAASNNVQAIVVNGGPQNNHVNGVFTTVTICAPASSNCQNINAVLVDTGSFGLRVLASALGALNSSLPQQKDGNGNPTVECAQFVSSVVWGPVKSADVRLAGEKASSVPIQVIDPSVAPIPSACKAIGPAEEDSTSLGANGILGIGFFVSDCGPACATAGSGNPGFYYSCSGSSCQSAGQPTNQQVQNPVALFSQDNNGVIVQLPSASSSAPSLSGSLIFGIGTQGNNALGAAQTYRPDRNGNLKTNFKGTIYEGFLDSGSNAYFFLSSGAVGMPNCPNPESDFYCPPSPVNLSATNTSASPGATGTINFTIDNANTLFSSSTDAVFPTLGGSNPSTFDWGLPFFFGRNVFVAFEPPGGSGPYWAY
jgi:hypothetical protein